MLSGEWTDIDTKETKITKAILEAAKLYIHPNHQDKHQQHNIVQEEQHGIRMTKHSYNNKLKEYRRHISPTNLEQVQPAYKRVYHIVDQPNATTILTQQRYGIKAAKGTVLGAPTHTRPQEEADSTMLTGKLTRRHYLQTNTSGTRTITKETYEPVDTDPEFTLYVLEYVLHRLRDTAPEEDTVCYSMIKNASRIPGTSSVVVVCPLQPSLSVSPG